MMTEERGVGCVVANRPVYQVRRLLAEHTAGQAPLPVSDDGALFDRAWILADDTTPYVQRAAGLHKGGDYGYPHAVEHDGALHVIVSRRKEAVEVLRAELPRP